jgi:hypothetical protein
MPAKRLGARRWRVDIETIAALEERGAALT